MIQKIKNFFTKGDERTVKLKINAILMLGIQAANMLISLLLVPITLNYVDSETYGIWLTLSSMVLWIRILDIGINNGLKNKLGQAFANNDFELGRKYVSTTYAMLSIIFLPVMLALLFITPFVNWISLLNIPNCDTNQIIGSICIIVGYFCLNFILSTINIVLYADQKPASANFRNLLQQVFSLVIIYVLTLTTKGSLLLLCAGLCLSPIIVICIFNITLFTGRYNNIAPSIKYIDFKIAPSILSLGVKFFIIQICFIIQYQISNFLILRYYGANDVTAYNIAFKYMNAFYTIWITLITPIWAASTDAFTKGKNIWIKNAISKYTRLFIILVVAYLLILFLADPIYKLWVGESIIIPFHMSLWIMLYNLIICYGAIFINVLNGAGILKVQTITSIISPVVFIVTFFILYKLGFDAISVPIAGILSSINGFIFAPLQCYLIFYKNKQGNSLLFK